MFRRSVMLGIVILVAAVSVLAPLLAQQKNSSGKTPPLRQPAASPITVVEGAALSEAEIRQRLEEKLDLTIAKLPLSSVLQSLQEGAGVNIQLDVLSLENEGLSPKEPITVDLEPVSAARLLDRVCEPWDLGWYIQDHVVHITTKIAAEEILVTRVYPVRDLIEYGEKFALKPSDETKASFLYYHQTTPATWLIDALQQYVAGPWADIDGTGGSISSINGTLVVRQTHEMQQNIAGILETLRKLSRGPMDSNCVPVRPPHYSLEEDNRVEKALGKVINLHCKSLPLNELASVVSAQLKIPVMIETQALDDEGLNPAVPVTLHLNQVTARAALNVAIDPLGLTLLVNDGRLMITTELTAEDRLHLAIHDVRDLENAGLAGRSLSDLLMTETSGPWTNIDGAGGDVDVVLQGVMFVCQTQKIHWEIASILEKLRKQIPDAPMDVQQPTKRDPGEIIVKFHPLETHARGTQSNLLKAIPRFVEPSSWHTNTQTGKGEISVLGHHLVVKNRRDVQTQVQEFLRSFHQAENLNTPQESGGGLGGGGGGFGGGSGVFRIAPK